MPKNFILGLWHNNIFAGITSQINNPHVVMVSRSKDAELVAITLKRMGHYLVRGSGMRTGESRGGKEAKNQMANIIKKGIPGAIAIDGPVGPVYKVKAGIIHLAYETKTPIVPYIPLAKNFWEFKSWDKFRLPKPFSEIIICYGKPIYVNERSDFERAKEDLEKALNDSEKELEVLSP